jgi:hypothetical protein
MARGTTKHPSVGKRVQIPAYTDLWMRGARFGTVVRVIVNSTKSFIDPKHPHGRDVFMVRMDHPQVRQLAAVYADDCTYA